MKTYILTIIGAAVLASFASMLSPDTWRKYVGVITGLVIISCIVAPVAKFSKTDLFSGFEAIEDTEDYNKNLQLEIVKDEMEKRIEEDISQRLKNEFGMEVSPKVEIGVNENGEIEGVKEIRIKGAMLPDAVIRRLCEIYGVSEVKRR